jgi:lysophospholipase L1-like esterase
MQKRGLIGLCVAVAIVLCAVFSSAASAYAPIKETYLALGDSYAFGYSLQQENENAKTGDLATSFEHGYVNDYFSKLKPKTNGIQLQNLGCPGETTESFVGSNPVLVGALEANFGYNAKEEVKEGVGDVYYASKNAKGEEEISLDNEEECAYHNRDVAEAAAQKNSKWSSGYKLPLHIEYSAFGPKVKSQLEAALAAIAADEGTGKPVTTISLDIGGNDELHFIKQCTTEGEAYGGEYAYIHVLLPAGFNGYGVFAINPEATSAEVLKYAFEEAAVGNPTVFASALATAKAEAENFVTAEPEFKTHHAPLGCLASRITPTVTRLAGNVAAIVAAIRNGEALGGINYTGKIVFVNGYNPYGNVAKRATKKEELEEIDYELLKGSNQLAYVTNYYLESAAKLAALGLNSKAEPIPGAASGEICVAETLKKFNTQSGSEPHNLQHWTNMANGTETEVEVEGEKVELKNGPDIHPTPLGYTVMANVMTKEATCTP